VKRPRASCEPDEHARRATFRRATAGGAVKRRTLEEAAKMFEAAGDAQRLRLLLLLAEGPKSVAELAAQVERSPALVSQQLRVLRLARLARGVRDGRFVFYRLFDRHTELFIMSAIAHVQHRLPGEGAR
jgi:DNA-binding transcriptional ArsR family regulator